MHNPVFAKVSPIRWLVYFCLFFCLFLLNACGGTSSNASSSSSARLATKQSLNFPNVGIQDLATLDPAEASDENSLLAITMVYSGLVRLDQKLNVIPDQATWAISPDRKVYTFYLKPGITFSDGTPLSAETYVYTLTRALSPSNQPGDVPEVQSENAMLFLGNIVGATAVHAGRSTRLSGIKALNVSTLVITLTKPTEYFLQALANPLAFAVNQKFASQYDEVDWSDLIANNGVGTGPFLVKKWLRNTKLVLVPNPHYYGSRPRLSEVDMLFMVDAHTAFQTYKGGQYSFVWNITPADLSAAHGLSGFVNRPLLETDALFFNTHMPPFDQPEVRQAFALALDKTMLAQAVLNNSAVPASTLIPQGIPGYQPALTGLTYSRTQALTALHSIYPDVSKVPEVTFSYPNSLVSEGLADSLQQMWQVALGIPVRLVPVETNAYNIEVTHHLVQLGFEQWSADFPDPYDMLALNLLSSASGNAGLWQSNQFDSLVQMAEQTSGAARLSLYGQAEQVALNDAALLPLDHQALAAVIPPALHGVSLNPLGLYFGDWSDVYFLQH